MDLFTVLVINEITTELLEMVCLQNKENVTQFAKTLHNGAFWKFIIVFYVLKLCSVIIYEYIKL